MWTRRKGDSCGKITRIWAWCGCVGRKREWKKKLGAHQRDVCTIPFPQMEKLRQRSNLHIFHFHLPLSEPKISTSQSQTLTTRLLLCTIISVICFTLLSVLRAPLIYINMLKHTVIQVPTAVMLKDVVLFHALHKLGDSTARECMWWVY